MQACGIKGQQQLIFGKNSVTLVKQSGVEPDMPKTGRRGDFSHFCPCRALARLRTQKQKFIHADTVFGASSLKQNDFCVGKA